LNVKNVLSKIAFWSRRDEASTESLRGEFRTRYHHFKLLLNSNNKALRIMSEMEETLQGSRPYGMTHVRAMTTGVSSNVYQIIQHLNALAPGRYEKLFPRFKEIQGKIEPIISPPRESKGPQPLVIPLDELGVAQTDLVGSKMANLGEIGRVLGLATPKGFVITAEAYRRLIEENDLRSEINRLMQARPDDSLDSLYATSSKIQQLIFSAKIPPQLRQAVYEQYEAIEKQLGKGVRVAMRSSALGEDLEGTSFAGQYRSELNVSKENIIRAYRNVVASKYGLSAMNYRLNRGIREEDVAMCVGCMTMVDSVSGGVAYSRDPMSIRQDQVLINSAWGLPKAIVDGDVDPDVFRVSRGDPMRVKQKNIPVKDIKYVNFPDEGISKQELDEEEGSRPSLTDEQAVGLAEAVVGIEEYYGRPQDVEWALTKDGDFVFLQSRPLAASMSGGEHDLSALGAGVLLTGEAVGSPGAAAGPVFVVRKDADELGFPQGAVLVASQARPRLAALLNRAAAVITEKGSVAGHLSNVAREFGVPVLLRVKDATTKLENGQMVTVDADGLAVHRGEVMELLKDRAKPRDLMEGSPVHTALKKALELIEPLNLLDPDSPHFKPKYCETFHDITRFCHGKAVEEMFSFGGEHRFPRRAAKRLVCGVPMQYWVLDLDDGFTEHIQGPRVTLDQIASIPMLALWEGMTAVEWEGPPPVNTKGFMSVLLEATANPALVPGLGGAQYAVKNYFMISKHYCSLQSRFGFHFSTVEALISDRSLENYASFMFKGGAANLHRRAARVHFISRILEDFEFSTDVVGDSVRARLEGHGQRYMKARLKVLGYLIIHTRQLDMIMADPASISHYRGKMTRDINSMIAGDEA